MKKFFGRGVVPRVIAGAFALGVIVAFPALAASPTTVNLLTTSNFAVLAGTAITNIPTSVLTGDVGLSPAAGSNYSGLTASEVTGTIYAVDATGPAGSVNNPGLLTTAKNDLTTAYLDAAGRTPDTTFVAGDNQLGGQTLTAGVYRFGAAATANLTAASPLVLDAQGDPGAVFIFQATSSLVTASSSVVQLVNGAQACNVFWQVGSSVTLGSSSTFVGTIMALTAGTVNSSANIEGRILARNAAVTLSANTITRPTTCLASSTGGSSSGGSSSSSGSAVPGLPNTGTSEGVNIRDIIVVIVTVTAVGAVYAVRKR